jgi:surface protein
MWFKDVFAVVYLWNLHLWDWIANPLRGTHRRWSGTTYRSSAGFPSGEQSEHHLFHLVDLCLFRKTDELGQHVLPYGIRRLIKDYIGALDNDSIRTAVRLWIENRDDAIARYGHISLWDTHRVTDMSRLFYNQQLFNDDISGWDVSKVTNLSHRAR